MFGNLKDARFRKQIIISAQPHYQELNERQRGILRYVSKSGHITTKEYQKLFGTSERQASRDVNELVKHGFFITSGSGRSSRYELTSTLKEQYVKWDED